MPALVVPNTVQVRMIWQASAADFAVNVLHFRNSLNVPVDQALATGIASDVNTAWGLVIGATGIINSGTRIHRVAVRNLNTANQPEFLANVANAVGNGAAEILPKQVALCVTLRTALAGRSYRGRVYIPGFTEIGNAPGGVATTAVQAFSEGLVVNIRQQLSVRGLLMGVVSTRINGAPRPTNVITDVTQVVARDVVWDNQRRRNIPGIGA